MKAAASFVHDVEDMRTSIPTGIGRQLQPRGRAPVYATSSRCLLTGSGSDDAGSSRPATLYQERYSEGAEQGELRSEGLAVEKSRDEFSQDAGRKRHQEPSGDVAVTAASQSEKSENARSLY